MKPEDFRILAVDDDPMMLESITDLFKFYKFQVEGATSGNQAWAKYQERPFDLVVTDVRMPDGDGISLARNIKEKGFEQTSVLLISGFSDMINEDIYHIGIEGIFSKPFDAKAVREAIQACLLAPEAKWSKQNNLQAIIQISKKAKSLEELSARKEVVFGRGGFFSAFNKIPPKLGSTISFVFEIDTPEQKKISGKGIVRWIQSNSKGSVPAGIGIEIVSMPATEAVHYRQSFGKIISFIPSPRRLEPA